MSNEFAAALMGAVVGGVLSMAGSVATTLFTDFKTQVRAEGGVLKQVDRVLASYIRQEIARDAQRREQNLPARLTEGEGKAIYAQQLVTYAELRDLAYQLTLKRHAELAVLLWACNGTEGLDYYRDLKDRVATAINPRLKKRGDELRRTV